MSGPVMKDIELLIQAGIDPKTGVPLKVTTATQSSMLKEEMKKNLRIKDEQQAINRYTWYNLPPGLDSKLVERILYYRGEGALFYMKANNTFYFLPFTLQALDGTGIDCYGRYTNITPLPFNGSVEDKKKTKPWIIGLNREPQYEVWMDLITPDLWDTKCVLLSDYSKQQSQNIIPRQRLNETIIDAEAEMVPFMRTALQNQTGVQAVRVSNEDEYNNVNALNRKVEHAALNGEKYMAVVGGLEFQELGEGPLGRAEDFMKAYESLDNLRLGFLGIDNGGVLQKNAHMLQSEQNMAGGAQGFIVDDGLWQRQHFCDIVNSIWGLGVSCELSENILGDTNMDGAVFDDQDQSGQPGEQDYLGGNNDVNI